MAVSLARTAESSATVTAAPLIVTAVLVPAIVRVELSPAVAVTLNALPAGAEPPSRASLKRTVSVEPFTVAERGCGLPPSTLCAGLWSTLAKLRSAR